MERPSARDQARVLDGARLLVVEDEFIILLELESLLLEAGAAGVRLCRTVAEAMRHVEQADEAYGAAVLDVRVGQNNVAPVARALERRGVPFVFYTGQTANDPIRTEWPKCEILSKPSPARTITATLARLIDERARLAG